MIRHGRRVLDRRGIAELHGISWSVARSGRGVKPWDDPDNPHPEPVNASPDVVKLRNAMWDEEQATAFAAGTSIPDLPTEDHEEDLLTDREAAAYLGLPLREFRDSVSDGRIPEADEKHFRVHHWLRKTLDAVDRPGKPFGGGAFSRSPDGRTPRERMQAALAEWAPDTKVTAAALARVAAVQRSTARKFLAERRDSAT